MVPSKNDTYNMQANGVLLLYYKIENDTLVPIVLLYLGELHTPAARLVDMIKYATQKIKKFIKKKKKKNCQHSVQD